MFKKLLEHFGVNREEKARIAELETSLSRRDQSVKDLRSALAEARAEMEVQNIERIKLRGTVHKLRGERDNLRQRLSDAHGRATRKRK